MKRIYLIAVLIIATVATNAQTWGYPQKNQPIQFNNNIVLGDTLGIDTSSSYDSYGSILATDTTSDGRWYFKTITSPTSTIVDSVKWVAVAAGSDNITTKTSGASVNIGTKAAITDIDFQVEGVTKNGVSTQDLNASGRLTLANIIYSLTGDGNDSLTEIVGAQAGVELTFYNADASSVYISPYSFGQNSQTLRTLSGNPITLGEFDVVKILCISDIEFYQLTAVQNNQ